LTQENDVQVYVISGFCCNMGENFAVLDYFASSGNFFPTFQNSLLVLSSGFKNPTSKGSRIQTGKDTFWILDP
jgi:hypothetical protein